MSETIVVVELEHQGKRGKFEMNFQEWTGSTIEIAFKDRLYRNRGVIRFDGATANATISTEHPYVDVFASPQEYNEYFLSILKLFSNAYTFGWSPAPEQMISYDQSYHEGKNYTNGDPKEVAIKEVQAEIIHHVAEPRKCLVAGCSNGELVRQARRRGIDVWGFDLIPNLSDIAFHEVRNYLRRGSLTEIPFAAQDGFDTLVAVDVLEHIPERDLPKMVAEWNRLHLDKLVLLINLNQFWFPGHTTLRPLSWWVEQWKADFRLSQALRRLEHLPSIYSNSGLYNQQWTLWERV